MATGRVPTTANSPLTAKGDLFGYSTTQARVAVGNDGETLVADSSASVGLRYSPTPAASNPIINSGFEIWQRGTSDFTPINASFTYFADRWSCFRSAGSSGALAKYVSSTGLAGIPNAGRMQRTSGNTSTDTLYFLYDLESKDSTKYQSKTITLSFYARRGANFSAGSNLLSWFMYSGTGTDQGGFASGWTGAVAIVDTQNSTLTTDWVRYQATGTVSSTANQIGMTFFYAGVGTAGAADYFDITGVQIDVGSVALPYRRNSETIQGELAACQRYYQAFPSATQDGYALFGSGYSASTTKGYFCLKLNTPMRTSPTMAYSAGNTFAIHTGVSTVVAGTAIGTDRTTAETVWFNITVASGLTAGNGVLGIGNNTTSAKMEASSEL